MAKKRNGNGYGKGTWVDTSMILSKAFLSLGVKGSTPIVSHASPKILMMLLAKRQFDSKEKGQKRGPQINGSRLILTYAEMESHIDKATGRPIISRKSITRGIDELLAKGFIEIVDPGGCYEQHKAVYGLTDDYLLWQPGQVIRIRERDVKRGYQGKQSTPTKNTADVNDPHPHGRQRPTPTQRTRALTTYTPPKAPKKEAVNGDA